VPASLGQAARLLGMNVDQLRQVEKKRSASRAGSASAYVASYGVNWLSGRGELRDYALLKDISDGDRLTFRDRDDMLAELYASWPRTRRIAR